jgi:hypothetical protein
MEMSRTGTLVRAAATLNSLVVPQDSSARVGSRPYASRRSNLIQLFYRRQQMDSRGDTRLHGMPYLL